MNVVFNVAAAREGATAATGVGETRMGAAMIGGLRFQRSHGEREDVPAGRAFASEAEATRVRMVPRMYMLAMFGSRVVSR